MQNENNLVLLINNKPATTSLKIAEIFNKQHKSVIRSLENLECSKEFRSAHFCADVYLDQFGRKQKLYIIDRDGFTILAMGFTGKIAMMFKEAYINAFNKMENHIRQQNTNQEDWLQKELLEIIKKEQEREILNAVNVSRPVITLEDKSGNKYVFDFNKKIQNDKKYKKININENKNTETGNIIRKSGKIIINGSSLDPLEKMLLRKNTARSYLKIAYKEKDINPNFYKIIQERVVKLYGTDKI